MYILEKMSAPGWTKKFDDKDTLEAELSKCICDQCKSDAGGSTNVYDLLDTVCGYEYFLDENHGA